MRNDTFRDRANEALAVVAVGFMVFYIAFSALDAVLQVALDVPYAPATPGPDPVPGAAEARPSWWR